MASLCLSGEAHIAFEETVTFGAINPVDDGTVLHLAQFAQIAAWMVSDLVESNHACVAIVLSGKERWHTVVFYIIYVLGK